MSIVREPPEPDRLAEREPEREPEEGGTSSRRMAYSCARCGYVTDHLGAYKKHLGRRKLCPPTVADVAPTLGNMRVDRRMQGRAAAPGAGAGGGASLATVTGDHNTTIAIEGDNARVRQETHTHEHEHQHTHTHNIFAFGREDVSHLTPEIFEMLARLGAKNGDAAVTHLVALVHFNPHKPENMNVRVDARDEDVKVYDGRAWQTERAEGYTVSRLICDKAADLMEFVGDNAGRLRRAAADGFEAYYDTPGLEAKEGLREQVRGAIERGTPLVEAAHVAKAGGAA